MRPNGSPTMTNVKLVRFSILPLTLAAFVGISYLATPQAADAVPDKVDFNKQIRPLLSKYCYQCHGPDEKVRKGGLRLDQKAGAFGVLNSGSHAIVPGKLDKSKLVERITHTDKSKVMPPAKTGKVLSPEEISLLEQWIE